MQEPEEKPGKGNFKIKNFCFPKIIVKEIKYRNWDKICKTCIRQKCLFPNKKNIYNSVSAKTKQSKTKNKNRTTTKPPQFKTGQKALLDKPQQAG